MNNTIIHNSGMNAKSAVIVFHKNIYQIYEKIWIKECIDSIMSQTYQEFDIYEVNYGGGDVSLFKEYNLKKLNKKHAFYSISLPDHTYAMNFIINKAFDNNYDVIFNSNLDDIYNKDRFDRQIRFVNKGYDLTSSYWEYIENSDSKTVTKLMGYDILFQNLKKENKNHNKYHIYSHKAILHELNNNHNVINHSGICITRKFWERYDNFGNLLRYRDDKPFEDLMLWKRAVESNVKTAIIPEYLIRYRIHNNSVSSVNNNSIVKKEPDTYNVRLGILCDKNITINMNHDIQNYKLHYYHYEHDYHTDHINDFLKTNQYDILQKTDIFIIINDDHNKPNETIDYNQLPSKNNTIITEKYITGLTPFLIKNYLSGSIIS